MRKRHLCISHSQKSDSPRSHPYSSLSSIQLFLSHPTTSLPISFLKLKHRERMPSWFFMFTSWWTIYMFMLTYTQWWTIYIHIFLEHYPTSYFSHLLDFSLFLPLSRSNLISLLSYTVGVLVIAPNQTFSSITKYNCPYQAHLWLPCCCIQWSTLLTP